tara:strand:- start:272 stop:457 length:186 start_codon:yes stop_codon:yes gene_type:complete
MITTWQIILTIIIVGLSFVMPIYYFFQRRKILKKKDENTEEFIIRKYINKINNETKDNDSF